MEDQIYIQRCIELAKKATGNTYPNPLVGAVIVHEGKIIGEGFHRKAGENHAEINAITSVKDQSLLPNSTIYVSLEPCSHYGKTPPCALKIIEKKFKKVVIGALDSHKKVNGKGIKILQEAGIELVSGVLEDECKDLNKRFFTFHEKKRPYIFLKWAESDDGFMDKNFEPYAISNALVNQYTHQMRSDEHAILVGTQTVLNDNPNLTVRNVGGKNPVRILIDFDLKVPRNFNIYNDEAKTFIFNSKKNLVEENIHFIKIGKENFLKNLMQKLYELQIQSIIVEGGSFTLQQFIDDNLWDEAIVIKNKNLVLEIGTKAPKFNFKPNEIKDFEGNIIEFYYNIFLMK